MKVNELIKLFQSIESEYGEHEIVISPEHETLGYHGIINSINSFSILVDNEFGDIAPKSVIVLSTDGIVYELCDANKI